MNLQDHPASNTQIPGALGSESSLVNKNVVVNGRRTSIRLEPAYWEALYDIARREKKSLTQIVSAIEDKRSESSFTAAVRVATLNYFRTTTSVLHFPTAEAAEALSP